MAVAAIYLMLILLSVLVELNYRLSDETTQNDLPMIFSSDAGTVIDLTGRERPKLLTPTQTSWSRFDGAFYNNAVVVRHVSPGSCVQSIALECCQGQQ